MALLPDLHASPPGSGLLRDWPLAPDDAQPARGPDRRVSFAPMLPSDLDGVCAVEKAAYAHPWSHKHFADSLASAYPAILLLGEAAERETVWPVRADGRVLLGYIVAMAGVDEVHLLNVTVSPAHQRQGWAHCLIDALAFWSRGQRAEALWLEVRAGNERARHVYERYGFQAVGLRKGYYPAGHFKREDAVVMKLNLATANQENNDA